MKISHLVKKIIKVLGQGLLVSVCIIIGSNFLFSLIARFPWLIKVIEAAPFVLVSIYYIYSLLKKEVFTQQMGRLGGDSIGRDTAGRDFDEVIIDRDIVPGGLNPPKPANTRGCILSPFIIIALIILLFFLFRKVTFSKIGYFFIVHNLLSSFLFVLIFLQFTLRKHILVKQTWKKITEIWLKWTGVSALSVGGFGFIANNDAVNKYLLNITVSSPIVDMKLMITLYFTTVIVTFIALLLTHIGRISSDSEDTAKPLKWFVPAFILSWISFFTLSSLLCCSLLLTFHAHLTKTSNKAYQETAKEKK